ncbi:MAG: NAD+ kinase [Acidobacteria bacterium]|nr:NAD+ kinase [Acidobacteriota bacterium]
MANYEKLVVVTRATRLDGLVKQFNTVSQAKFYNKQAGVDFADYQNEHDAYQGALDIVRRESGFGLKTHFLDRELVPTYLFAPTDIVVALGQDGLVANTAKYIGKQPLIGVNPEPARFDGVLLPFSVDRLVPAVHSVLAGRAKIRQVTLAEAVLNDGQRLLAFNDLFIGARSHVSARYKITYCGKTESQSSSGVLVATGAGSTGWLSSMYNMAAGLTSGSQRKSVAFPWESRDLFFVVREPFASKHSQAGLVAGPVHPDGVLRLESSMPQGGAIFSDGVEAHFLNFNSGSIATIRAAEERAHLVVG